MCSERGTPSPATVADHVMPHKGDWNAFMLGKLQSLCSSCHDKTKAQIERAGYSFEPGADGFPADRRHPFYR